MQTYDKYDPESSKFYNPLAWINETSIWTVRDPHAPLAPLHSDSEDAWSNATASDAGLSDALMSSTN